MRELNGRVAVVTGAASGIGRGLAGVLASRGAHVVVADRNAEGVKTAVEELGAAHPGVEFFGVPTDVSDQAAVQALADAAFDRFGRVDLLCNNAGVATSGYLWEGPLSDWQEVLSVNLMGAVHGIRAFLPRMLANGEEGHVVNTSSMAGMHGVPFTGPYAPSKHALVGLSRSLRDELQTIGAPIGVSVVCPGPVATGIMDAQQARYRAAGAPELPAAARAVLDQLTEVVSDGISPEEAGRIIVEAVMADHFWVFPNAGPYLDRVVQEYQEFLEQSGLHSPSRVPIG